MKHLKRFNEGIDNDSRVSVLDEMAWELRDNNISVTVDKPNSNLIDRKIAPISYIDSISIKIVDIDSENLSNIYDFIERACDYMDGFSVQIIFNPHHGRRLSMKTTHNLKSDILKEMPNKIWIRFHHIYDYYHVIRYGSVSNNFGIIECDFKDSYSAYEEARNLSSKHNDVNHLGLSFHVITDSEYWEASIDWVAFKNRIKNLIDDIPYI